MIEFILNNKHIKTNLSPTTVLLDFIRNEIRLTGTKEGCREGDCGACTVLIGNLNHNKVKYLSVNSCLIPLANTHGKHVVTIEGLNQEELSPVQAEMVDEGGTQCGFCTPGFIVSMCGYFLNNEKQNLVEGIEALGGNICRCTGYKGIIRSLEKAISAYEKTKEDQDHFNRLIEAKFIPHYFNDIKKQLTAIKLRNTVKNPAHFLVGGGTDLYVQRWEDLVQSSGKFISDINIPNEIIKIKNTIKIGGAVTVQQILESKIIKKYFPSLSSQLELFGSLPIRNRATIAGNIVNASPIGDITNILIALDAKVHLKNKSKRIVHLRKFYKGYKYLDKKKNEVIEFITVKIPVKNFHFNFEKVSKRTYLDIASVNTSVIINTRKNKINSIGLAAGGVAPIPLYLGLTCKYLKGKEISNQNIKDASGIALKEISPISDARGSAQYKSLLLRQLIYSHFIKLFPEKINVEELI